MVAALPDWMDTSFLEGASAVLIFVAIALIIVTLITVRSLGTRIIVMLLLGAAAFGAFQYRQHVEDCAKTCDCSVFGEDVPEDDGCVASAKP